MPIANVTCIYDSQTNKSGSVLESSTQMYISIGGQDGFLQFNIPALDEIYLSSAKLFLFLVDKGGNVKVVPTLYNVDDSLSGKPYSTYMTFQASGLIAEAAESYAPAGANIVQYHTWTSLDITELMIGYLGRNYYTLGLIGKTLSSGSFSAPAIGTIEAGRAAYIEIEYEYAVPFKPTIVYPLGEAISNTGTLTFEWRYHASGASVQQKFDLQWKMQSNTTWNTVTQTTSNTAYTMNASAFTNGIVEWQVRTYNKHNMVSEWATSQFVVIGKPGNPVITGVKNDAITEITWNANKQEESAARVQIRSGSNVIYDSGVIPAGIEDAHKPDLILDNGNYIAVLAISNMYGMWSNEITYPFTISNTKPSVTGFSAVSCGDYVKLTYTGTDHAEYYIYRAEGNSDFIPIGRTAGWEYNDYAVKSGTRYRYYVRCYLNAYRDTEIRDVSVKYSGLYLSGVTNMERRVNLVFHDRELFLPFKQSARNDNALILYSGRKKRVKESGIHYSESINLEVFVKKQMEPLVNAIHESNDVFCLRGADFVMYCDITDIGKSATLFNKGYLLSLVFDDVDYNEKVRFNG